MIESTCRRNGPAGATWLPKETSRSQRGMSTSHAASRNAISRRSECGRTFQQQPPNTGIKPTHNA